jgi:hypothetical protein
LNDNNNVKTTAKILNEIDNDVSHTRSTIDGGRSKSESAATTMTNALSSQSQVCCKK